ncbi:MAG TPA: SOS response-associated peptidase [Candidatus Limnocylindrales bacterium]
MCGRFQQQTSTSELARIFGAEDLTDDPAPAFNVAPTDEASVVVERDRQRAIVRYRWGLIPPWVDDPKIASKTFNARAETLTTSPMFREAFKKRRCLVPVDGFYEWHRSGKDRVPLTIFDPDGLPLALAGLWTGRQDPATGEWNRTFTVITSRPNEFMAQIHNRMPVIIAPDKWALWLDRELRDPGELQGLLEPNEGLPLDAYVISPLVNNVRNDGPDLLLPAQAEGGLLLP